MPNHKDISEQIEAYLNGELSGTDLQKFEAQLNADIVLQQEVKKAKAVNRLILQNRLLNVKDLANKEYDRVKDNNGGKFTKYLVSSGIGVAIVLSGLFFLANTGGDDNPPTPIEKEEQSPSADSTEYLRQLTHKKEDTLAVVAMTEKVVTKKEDTKHTEERLEKTNVDDNFKNTTETNLSDEKVHALNSPPAIQVESITKSKKDSATESASSSEKTAICELKKIEAKITTTSGCIGENQNSIQIAQVTGTKNPVTTDVYNSLHQKVDSYFDLKDGHYTISITDADNCEKEYVVHLKSKNCPINVDFNPHYGEVWDIPVYTAKGKLTVYTKNGLAVFEKEIMANEATNWEGKNSNAEILSGYFIFTINYEDGHFLKGGITVTH